MKCLSKLPMQERPREKLNYKGAKCLSDVELLSVLLGSGVRRKNVLALADELLPVIDSQNGNLKPEDLQSIKGIGTAKSVLICAALEFARRRIPSSERKIRTASDVLPLVNHLADRKQEHFICVSLNGAQEIIATRTVTIGLVNACQIHPREVFADPLMDRACSIIVAHNHPSGDLEPSDSDRELTDKLYGAGELLGIQLLDHLIFSTRGYFSFKNEGLL